jgi:acid phosphatase (class A)
MTNFHSKLIIGAVTAFSLLSSGAQAPKPHKPVFILPEQLDVASILPNPPSDNSTQALAELAEVHRLQDTRQTAQIAHAKADDAEEDIFVFKNVLGDKFSPANLPLTALLSAHVHNDEGVIVGPAKKYFHRLRPFNFQSSVKPVCKTNSNIDDYSYPSGHSTTGYLEALVLTMIVPEKRDAILERADDYAYSRVVCGVHYRTDVEASKSVAYAMIGVIMNNPQFKEELKAARSETRGILGI